MVASEVEPSHLYGSARLWFFVLSFTRKKRRSRLMDRMTTNVNFPHSSSSFVGCTMGAKHCEKSNDLVEGATRLSKRRVFVLSSDLRALGGLRKSHEANNWILELFLTFFRNCVENRANLQRRLHTLQFSIEVSCASGSEIEITILSKINLLSWKRAQCCFEDLFLLTFICFH